MRPLSARKLWYALYLTFHLFPTHLFSQAEAQLLGASTSEKALINASKPEDAPKKKKGPKGPNPLSVKKKKVEPLPSLLNKKGATIDQSNACTDKGKGKEASTAESVRQEASLGKRKRSADDEGGVEAGGEGKGESMTNTGEMSSAKKRRRRRKKLQEASAGAGSQDNDSPNS